MRSTQGVPTRKVKRITDKLCGQHFSRETVSRIAKRLDEQIAAWAERELRKGYPFLKDYLFLIVDAMQIGDDTSPEVLERGIDDATAVLALPSKYRR